MFSCPSAAPSNNYQARCQFYPALCDSVARSQCQRHVMCHSLLLDSWDIRWKCFLGTDEVEHSLKVLWNWSWIERRDFKGLSFCSGTDDKSQLLRKCLIMNCSVLQWNSRHAAYLSCKQQNSRRCLLWSNRTGQHCNIEDLKCAYREAEKPRAGQGWISKSSKNAVSMRILVTIMADFGANPGRS